MLGTIGLLTGCGPAPDPTVQVRQNNYASLDDCRKDWGRDGDRECRPRSGGGYVGPRYIWNHNAGYPMAVNSDGSTRPLSNSYLSQSGGRSAATSATVSTVHTSSFGGGGGHVGGGSVSRGGFGGFAHGFSGGS